MVQIIQEGRWQHNSVADNFISHMVQIILVLAFAKSHEFPALYIPHGSDNTVIGRDGNLLLLHIFISHMVQIIPLPKVA